MADARRFRVALLLLVIGTSLILGSLGLILYVSDQLHDQQAGQDAGPLLSPRARLLYTWLLVSVVLLLVFIVGTVLMGRWSRHYREQIARRRPSPTATEDVWRMYRLPDDWQS